MAVSILSHSRLRAAGSLQVASAGALCVSLIAPALDIIGVAQHEPVLSTVAAASCLVASLALLLQAFRQPATMWVFVSALAFGVSTVMRLSGMAEGPLLAALGVLALGLAGAFASPLSAGDLLAQNEVEPAEAGLAEAAKEASAPHSLNPLA